ncbi:hypothetical protein [Streptomyces sp. NBC_00289]|uniref:hypothetical protein n=1 Tax=Streptomyces sp. NBC_00289 TaxID=2975703 RepID=UPI00352CA65F
MWGVGAGRILSELGIAESRRVQGIGPRQREHLLKPSSREVTPPCRCQVTRVCRARRTAGAVLYVARVSRECHESGSGPSSVVTPSSPP